VFTYINKYLGWRNWAVLTYNSVAENMFAFFYIALIQRTDFFHFISDFFVFFLFSILCTSYGFLINDLGDRELDRLHGKANTFSDDSHVKALLIVLLFLGMSIPLGLYFINRYFFLLLWIVWIFIGTAYSIKPFRLKERGKTGLLLVVMAQRVIPALMIFSAFDFFAQYEFIALTIYIFFRGFSSDVNHQVQDYDNDVKTSTETFAVQTGSSKARVVLRVSLEIEKVMLLACLIIFYFRLREVRFHDLSAIMLLPAGYLILYLIHFIKIIKKPSIDVNPFTVDGNNIFQFIHHTFPTIIVAFYLLCMLVYLDWRYLLLLFPFMIYRGFFSASRIRNSYPVRMFFSLFKKSGIFINE